MIKKLTGSILCAILLAAGISVSAQNGVSDPDGPPPADNPSITAPVGDHDETGINTPGQATEHNDGNDVSNSGCQCGCISECDKDECSANGTDVADGTTGGNACDKCPENCGCS